MRLPASRALGLGAAGVALLVLAVLLGEALGWPLLREPLQNRVASRSGLPTTLEEPFRLRLLGPPRLDVGRLTVGAAPGLDLPHLLDAREVQLRWRWADLWRWRQGEGLRLRALQAGALDANLLRLTDGRASWRAQPVASAPQDALELPRFETLVVGQGRIAWRDQPLAVDLLIRLQGREGTAVSPDAAGYSGSIEGRYQGLPMTLQLQAGGTLPLLNEAGQDAPGVPLRIEGTVATSSLLFDGQAAALLGEPRWDGGLRFKGPSLAEVGRPLGVTLPQTPPFELRGHIAQSGGVWQLRVDQATVGRSQLQGALRFDQRAQPPHLSGQLRGPRLLLADLAPAIGGRGGKQADATPPGRVLPHRRLDLPSLQRMDADVQMRLDLLDLGSASLAPLRGLQTRVRLNQGVLRLEDLQAGVAGGQFRGRTQLDANATPARWQAQLRVSGIDLAGWWRGLRAEGASGTAPRSAAAQRRQRQAARQGGEQPVQAYLSGELRGELDVNGAGRSTAEILGSLNGRAQFHIREGTLSYLATEVMGLDVAQALGVAITGDRPLPLNCARLTLVANKGVIQPRPAVLDNVDSTIWLTGRVNLREETLDLRAITRPKDWSPLSLRTPLTVTGTLADPDVGIETGRLIPRVLGALALGALVGPVAALLPLIEEGDGNVENPCEPRTSGPPPPAPQTTPPPQPRR